jgi:hypothetical protein
MDAADLERELRGLAERVRAIEDRLGMPGEAKSLPALSIEAPQPAGYHPALQALGIAVVGLAGGYVLRALVDSRTVSAGPGVALGIAYAIGWLVWAAWRGEALYALASALVLAPLVWEATARFHVLTAWTGAATMLGFTLLGLAISWRRNLLLVSTVATIAGLGTAGALIPATHDVTPLVTAILAIAAAVEICACRDHWLSERWLAAAAADLAVLLATWLVTNPRGLPEGYAPIGHGWLAGAQVVLLGTYLASTIVRTLVRHLEVTAFEAAQCAAAFAIAMWGGLPVAPAMLAAGGACYVVSFVMLERGGGRNFYTYSTFGLLLSIAGTTATLSGSWATAVWAVAAIVCAWSRRVTLQVHAVAYLGLALTIAEPWAVAGASALCFVGAREGPLRLPLFAAAVWSAAGVAASIAPESLRLPAKLLVCGAGLILLPRL